MPPKAAPATTHATVRMYRFGTGDCFVLKFFAGDLLQCRMMIDCGVWTLKKVEADKIIDTLIKDLDGHVDILVVTHEHKDHVNLFDICRDKFAGLTVGKVWMGWTEDDRAPIVKEWKQDFGEKLKAIGNASKLLEKRHSATLASMNTLSKGNRAMAAYNRFMEGFRSLVAIQGIDEIKDPEEIPDDTDPDGYIGGMAGMQFVKKTWAKSDSSREFLKPGRVLKLPGVEGVKVYVLGPPLDRASVRKEHDSHGGSYPRNLKIHDMDALVDVLNSNGSGDVLPFESLFELEPTKTLKSYYDHEGDPWQSIDHEWLEGAGQLALRADGLTNNLSLALAIEFPSGRVMLFPGDAEYGSWASWQEIVWEGGLNSKNDGPFVNDLLGRTVFYKVAHHLSHNGTAKDVGLELMPSYGMTAMATLDYAHIAPRWKGTMPNHEIVKELLQRTSGRLIVSSTKNIKLSVGGPVEDFQAIIDRARSRMSAEELSEFRQNYVEHKHFHEYKVSAD